MYRKPKPKQKKLIVDAYFEIESAQNKKSQIITNCKGTTTTLRIWQCYSNDTRNDKNTFTILIPIWLCSTFWNE